MTMLNTKLDQRGLLTVSLDNPPVNALSRSLVNELNHLCDDVQDETVRMVVISAGGEHFCAGADLIERAKMDDAEVETFVKYLSDTFQRIADIPVPTLAAINGNCLGGGLELALACDMRIIIDDTFIGMKETSVGVIPGAGGTVRLPRLIGESKGKQWIFSAQSFTPEEALGDGVVDWLVETDELDDAVQEIFGQIVANSPLAVKAAKKSINRGLSRSVKQALEIEQSAYKSIIASEDRQEGLKAFREKRRPKWKGK